jgi:hypothetical protein
MAADARPARRDAAVLGAVLLWTLASYPSGLALGAAWLLPVLGTAPAYALMVARLRQGRRRAAVLSMLAWAAALGVGGTVTFALWPHDPGALVLGGPAYRDEMFAWIRSGVGSESTPSQFIPQHAFHLVAFAALALASAGAAGMTLGAVLMNYMSYYVASLARAGVPAATVVLFGWQPWAVCRVAAFCTLGVVLAEPLLRRLRPYAGDGLRGVRAWLTAVAVGLVLDVLLKAVLATLWGQHLRDALAGP